MANVLHENLCYLPTAYKHYMASKIYSYTFVRFFSNYFFCFVFLTTKSAAEDYTKNTGQVEERRGCDWGGGGGPPEC